MKRRTFIKQASALALSSSVVSSALASAKLNMYGLQLYSIRDLMQKDPKGTLKQIASFGYKQIESFGGAKDMCFGLKPAEFRDYLKSLGLIPLSSHMSYDEPIEGAIAVAKTVGLKYLIVPSIPDQMKNSLDNYKIVAAKLNQMGEACQKAGLLFGYHNHDFEFKNFNGQLPYDVLIKETDPKLVRMEMDIYWVVKGGQDPQAYFQKYPGRFELCHVKDMERTGKKESTEAGNGSINFTKIFQQAQKAGLKHYIVEQEYYNKPEMQSMKQSAQYLARMTY